MGSKEGDELVEQGDGKGAVAEVGEDDGVEFVFEIIDGGDEFFLRFGIEWKRCGAVDFEDFLFIDEVTRFLGEAFAGGQGGVVYILVIQGVEQFGGGLVVGDGGEEVRLGAERGEVCGDDGGAAEVVVFADGFDGEDGRFGGDIGVVIAVDVLVEDGVADDRDAFVGERAGGGGLECGEVDASALAAGGKPPGLFAAVGFEGVCE